MITLQTYQKAFHRANETFFQGRLAQVEIEIPEKAIELEETNPKTGKPFREAAYFDLKTLSIGMPKDTNANKYKAKSSFLHELTHYYLWDKYLKPYFKKVNDFRIFYDVKSQKEMDDLWNKVNHSQEFMNVFQALLKSQMPITKAKFFYCRSQFIDYTDNNRLKTFNSLVPWTWA